MHHRVAVDVMKILIDALLDFEFLIVRIHMVQHIGDHSVLLPFGVVELLQLLDELLLGLGFVESELLGLGLGVHVAEALVGFALPHVHVLRVEKPHPVIFILVKFRLHLKNFLPTNPRNVLCHHMDLLQSVSVEISISYQVCIGWELREIINDVLSWIIFIKGCEIVDKYRSSTACFRLSTGLYDLYGFPVLVIGPDLELIDELIVFQYFDFVVGSLFGDSVSNHSCVLVEGTLFLNRGKINFLSWLAS